HHPRRTARHGTLSRARGADAGALEGGDRAPRRVRSRRAAGARGGNAERRVHARQPETAGVRPVRRRELDPPLVQPRRRLELTGDRGAVRRFFHRRPAPGVKFLLRPPVPRTVSQTVCGTVSETVCDTGSETVCDTGSQTVSETVSQTVSQTGVSRRSSVPSAGSAESCRSRSWAARAGTRPSADVCSRPAARARTAAA